MTAGPDFGYGSQPGEYGDISDFGYGAQPGEYGVDANHGLVPLLTGLQYGANQGPPPPAQRVRMPPTSRHRSSAVRRRPRRLPLTVVASVAAVVALALGYRAADRTTLHVGVTARGAGAQREVVTVRLHGTLGWSHTTLTIGIIDAAHTRRLTVVRATGLCRLRRGQAAVRAPRNRLVDGACRLTIEAPVGRDNHHARVVLSVDGRAWRNEGITIRRH